MPAPGGLLIIGLLGAAVAVAASSSAHAAEPPKGGGTGPGGAIKLDPGMDPETQRAVLQALQTETDPAKLTGLADAIGEKYPMASAALLAKAAALAAADRASNAATAAAAGIPPAGSTIATPAIAMPPATTPPDVQPTVTPVPTFVPPAAPPAPSASPTGAPAVAPVQVGEPPTGTGTWVLASNADVARDGVASRYASLLKQSVGTTVTEDHGSRTWQFRVISKQTDPGLTTFAKDVKGWIWRPGAGGGTSPIAHATVPTVSPSTIASAPAKNAAIAKVQAQLNSLGAKPPLVVDGINGPKTIAAVKMFQQSHGLVVDGIAGPKTMAAMDAAGAVPVDAMRNPMTATPAAQPAAATAPVPIAGPVTTNKDVQNALNALGASPRLTVDGILGPLSQTAIRAFQKAHGLTVDGIAGPNTKAALTAALASGGGSSIAAGWGRPAAPRGAFGRRDRGFNPAFAQRAYGYGYDNFDQATWNVPPDPAWTVAPGSPYGPIAPPSMAPATSAQIAPPAMPAPPAGSPADALSPDDLDPASVDASGAVYTTSDVNPYAGPTAPTIAAPMMAPAAPSGRAYAPLPPQARRTVGPGPYPLAPEGRRAGPYAPPPPGMPPPPGAWHPEGFRTNGLVQYPRAWRAPVAAPGYRPLVSYRRKGRRAIP